MKKVGNIILDILVVLVVVFALAMTIMIISSKASGVPNILGYSPVTVQTDSMVPTFNPGDLLIIKKYDTTNLAVGDIITYKFTKDGVQNLNTHRIIEKFYAGDLLKYKTKGDHETQEDINAVVYVDVVGKWTGTRIAGLGKVLDFLKTQLGIFVCFVLPLALLFIWQLYKFIMLLAENKKRKAIDEVNAGMEEEKQKAVEEYIAQQKAQAQAEEKVKQVLAPAAPVGDGSSVPETSVVGNAPCGVPDEETAEETETVPDKTNEPPAELPAEK